MIVEFSIINVVVISNLEDNMRRMNEKVERFIPIVGILLGAIIFFIIFGPKILNPAYIGWTMEGDAAQHFLGWHFFRSEGWGFPLGIIEGYHYPQGTSLVYTDSIPLLAVPLKMIGSLLPAVFQYHGFWLLSAYILQGYFSILLLKETINRPALIILGACFFLLSPILVQRARIHESLTAHWIILAALYLYLQADTFKYRIRWLLLLALASLVHFYLLVMAAMIFLGYLLKQFLLNQKKLPVSLLKFTALAFVLTLIPMWLAGYFIFNVRNTDSGGFGNYSMNLAAPFNATPIEGEIGEFAFLEPIPVATHDQLFEGFNYLGLGLILLLLIAGFLFIRQRDAVPVRRYLPLILVGVVLFIISLSNKITLADKTLIELQLPFIVEKGLGIIRSSGRMFWPISYMVMLASIGVVGKYLTTKKAFLLLLALFVIQVVDLAPWYLNVNLDETTWESPLVSAEWEQLMETADHIVFIPPNEFDADIMTFAFLAASHGKTINVGPTARTDIEFRAQYRTKVIKEFEQGQLAAKTLYVIRDDAYLVGPIPDSDFRRRNLDGYNIVLPTMP